MSANTFTMTTEGTEAVASTLALMGTEALKLELNRLNDLSANTDRATAERYRIFAGLIQGEIGERVGDEN